VSAGYAQDRRAQAPVTVRPFQVRGHFLTALALRMETDVTDQGFFDALDEHLQTTPQFFADAPVVLDLDRARGLSEAARLSDLVEALRQRDLKVFGVQNAGRIAPELLQRLALIAVSNGRDAPAPTEQSGRGRRKDRLLPPDNKVITGSVRSGQMVITERGDLTIIGSVGSGAEVIAGGNIHIYGTLRGRALAGVQGDTGARIFCQRLDAELVAIAGLYQTSETLGPAPGEGGVQIFLKDDRLQKEALG
jgi:septum site-determining protein MinC